MRDKYLAPPILSHVIERPTDIATAVAKQRSPVKTITTTSTIVVNHRLQKKHILVYSVRQVTYGVNIIIM